MCFSHVLQQRPHHPCPPCCIPHRRRLVCSQSCKSLPTRVPKQHLRSHDFHWRSVHIHLLYLRLVCSSHFEHDLFHGRRTQQVANRSLWPRLLQRSCHNTLSLCHLCGFRQWSRVRGCEGSREEIRAEGRHSTHKCADERKQPKPERQSKKLDHGHEIQQCAGVTEPQTTGGPRSDENTRNYSTIIPLRACLNLSENELRKRSRGVYLPATGAWKVVYA